MVKRRRRQYPAGKSYGGSLNKKLVGRLVVFLVLVIAAYYAYPYVADIFSGSGGDTGQMTVDMTEPPPDSKEKADSRPAAEVRVEKAEPQAPQLPATSIQLEVLNGCGIAGLASRITDSLRTRGFDVVKTGNFQSRNVSETLVILRSSKKGAAQVVADYLGTKNVVVQTSPDLMLDVTIVIGKDYAKLNVFK